MPAGTKKLLHSSNWAGLPAAAISTTATATAAPAATNPHLLWDDKPAARWTEALPVGSALVRSRDKSKRT